MKLGMTLIESRFNWFSAFLIHYFIQSEIKNAGASVYII